jgi:hypothetical protein
MALLNTHATVKKFMQHGFSEEQAEVVVEAINDQNNNLATKTDLYNIELKLESKIESEISDVKSEIKVINTNINWLRAISVVNFTVLVGGVASIWLK